MAWETVVGRRLFAAMIGAIGALCLVYAEFAPGLEPVPRALGHPALWTWASGLALIAGALALLVGASARAGALWLALLGFSSTVLLFGPPLIAHTKAYADDAFHTLALGSAALALAVGTTGRPELGDGLARAAGQVARLLFGLCLVGFGVMHFVYFKFTADFVPAFIPLHAFWAAFTGAAQIAAGLAVLSGVLARLALRLSALMYVSWTFLVHLPRVMADPSSHQEWSDIFLVTALGAAALIVSGCVTGTAARRRP